MKRKHRSLGGLTLAFGSLLSSTGAAQQPTAAGSTQQTQSLSGAIGQAAANRDDTGNPSATDNRSWIARDPRSGRLYQQQLVTQTVPTTQWEVRPQTTTVYEARQVVKNVPTNQTTYTPTTQYVMQPRLRGWWNPLKAPVQSYEYVPVTTWQPQTQTVEQPVSSVEWVAKQQIVYVHQGVQLMKTQQQIVSRELPQPASSYLPGGSLPLSQPTLAQPLLANQGRPLFTIPLLAQQRLLPWPSPTYNPVTAPASFGLRPITRSLAPSYAPPLQASSAVQVARDPMQSGMSATVLR